VKFLTGGDEARCFLVRDPHFAVDLVKLQSRQLKSGWEKDGGLIDDGCR